MNAEFWILGGALVGILAAWLVDAVRAEWSEMDEWWTPRDPATVARRDVEKLLRAANRGTK